MSSLLSLYIEILLFKIYIYNIYHYYFLFIKSMIINIYTINWTYIPMKILSHKEYKKYYKVLVVSYLRNEPFFFFLFFQVNNN